MTDDIETEIGIRTAALQYQISLIVGELQNISDPLTRQAITGYAIGANACLNLMRNEIVRLLQKIDDMEERRYDEALDAAVEDRG